MASRAQILSELQSLEDGWSIVLAGLSNDQANSQPAAGRWSIAQNLDHINLSAKLYLNRILHFLELSKQSGAAPRPDTLAGNILIYLIRPPYRFRAKSPQAVFPAGKVDVAAAYTDFIKVNEQIRQLFKDYSDNELKTARLSSPLIKWIKLSAKQAIEVLIAHGQRHLFQVCTTNQSRR
jgi:hypothetical protein